MQPPNIPNQTDLLKVASNLSVNDINLAPVQKIREEGDKILKNQSTLRRAGRNFPNGTVT